MLVYYVYLLESVPRPEKRYVGFTVDLRERLARHNNGQNASTAAFRPWQLRAYFAFPNEDTAQGFEKYLKSGSGRTFSQRHFL